MGPDREDRGEHQERAGAEGADIEIDAGEIALGGTIQLSTAMKPKR
jgi:hypothetical protein